MGGPDRVLELYRRAWEGHLRQYTLAKTTVVPFARDGMYYKEFPVMMDWLHNGEGLTVFNLQGLSDPEDHRFQQRVKRFAGFYLNEDPGAPNYDFQHRIIRSLFNGSRGPLLRKAEAVDWAGDPIEVRGRFRPGHGEDSYEAMLLHFRDYNDIVGDHPQNLLATTLALNAFMMTQDEKYRHGCWTMSTRGRSGRGSTTESCPATLDWMVRSEAKRVASGMAVCMAGASRCSTRVRERWRTATRWGWGSWAFSTPICSRET